MRSGAARDHPGRRRGVQLQRWHGDLYGLQVPLLLWFLNQELIWSQTGTIVERGYLLS